MSELSFYSKLKQDFQTFVNQKRATGHPYVNSARILSGLDALIAESFPESESLTQEICEAWIAKCSVLHPNTLVRKITPVRQFAIYMTGTGKDAYIIPRIIASKSIKYDAHIFTEAELTAFFSAVDRCPQSPFSPLKSYIIPVVFRLLLTTGMRSSEVRLLQVDDVDLLTGKIYIRESKGWTERIIYIGNDMLDLLNRYNAIASQHFPNRVAFFPNQKGEFYSNCIFDCWFHEFWDSLPEAKICKGNKPRVHDFRHTFCVYRLNSWLAEGKDLNAMLPYLSEYVGHSNFADTDYYLSLAEPFYPEFRSRMKTSNTSILPEVKNEI